jgi:hypothetical protein
VEELLLNNKIFQVFVSTIIISIVSNVIMFFIGALQYGVIFLFHSLIKVFKSKWREISFSYVLNETKFLLKKHLYLCPIGCFFASIIIVNQTSKNYLLIENIARVLLILTGIKILLIPFLITMKQKIVFKNLIVIFELIATITGGLITLMISSV